MKPNYRFMLHVSEKNLLMFFMPDTLPNKLSISIYAQPKHIGLELRILFDMPSRMSTT